MFLKYSTCSFGVIRTNVTRFMASSVKPASSSSSTLSKSVGSTNIAGKTSIPVKDESKNPNTVKKYSKNLAQSLNGRNTFGSQQLESNLAGQNHALPKEENNDITSQITEPVKDIDWYRSWYGIGTKPFSKTSQTILQESLNPKDIEIKPDGILYLPEIKYRRILNQAFGAGAWGLVPRSETIVTSKLVTREYALICQGQLVSVARGEQDYFNEDGIPTATEGCKSNALMRCCKDLGVGSELWDPVFIKQFKEQYCQDKFVEHVTTKKKKKIWLRKDRKVEYPYK